SARSSGSTNLAGPQYGTRGSLRLHVTITAGVMLARDSTMSYGRLLSLSSRPMMTCDDAGSPHSGCSLTVNAQLEKSPRIASFQLIVSFHEATYQRLFRQDADLSGFKYHSPRVDRITVAQEGGQPPPPLPPPPQEAPQQQPHSMPQPLPLQPVQSHQPQEQQLPPQQQQQQQQHTSPSLRLPPPPQWQQGGPGRLQHQPLHQRHHPWWRGTQQPRSRGQGQGRGFHVPADQVRDEYLRFPDYSTTAFKVEIDRRLRPVVLAVHKREDCPLPLVGLTKPRHGTSAGDAAAAGGHGGGGSGERAHRQRETHIVRGLEDALQRMMDFIFAKNMSAVGVMASPLAGSRGDGDGCGGSSSSGGGDAAPVLPPPAPLIILANEGAWRDSRVIHLKAPVSKVTEYLRVLRTQLGEHGFIMTNHGNDTDIITNVLCDHHAGLTANYSTPCLQSIISNFSRLPEAQDLLESRSELFFRVPDETGQLSGSEQLGAVWYGCRQLPRLVATLPGRSVNGLSLEEALECMEALWNSELKRRLFESIEGEKNTAGLAWALVPCFA
ncbi:hypothetical protein VOLCADRAFT_92830, partial [Volvox carteri f. nagariensis]